MSFDYALFHTNSGICDNIYRCMPIDIRDKDDNHSKMTQLKDNIIRQVPSYSGEYHYPVKSHDPSFSAERMFDRSGDKWNGDYGANRLIQAQEILEYIKTKWDNMLIEHMTPARQKGITENSIVLNKNDSRYYVLSRDDDSRDPYFVPYENKGTDEGRRSIHLDHLTVVNVDKILSRTLTSLVSEMKRQVAKRKKLEDRIAALEKEKTEMLIHESSLDFALLKQHSVKFVK